MKSLHSEADNEGDDSMTGELPEALKTFRQEFDIRVFIDRNKGEWHMPMEWHIQLELFICIKGRGKYYIGDKVYAFEKGDIFVINDSELHKSAIYENEYFDAFIVMFSAEKMFKNQIPSSDLDLLDIFYRRPGTFSHLYRPGPDKQKEYQGMCDLMLKEYEERREGYKDALRALLTWMLLELHREYFRNEQQNVCYTVGEKLKHKKIISEVLNYIEQHYREDMNLGELAEMLYVNQSYLSREFKKDTGYSMIKFITNKRIREARSLLCDTDMLITDIATSVGYNNITHFNAMFKKEIGISPKEFRKQMNTAK